MSAGLLASYLSWKCWRKASCMTASVDCCEPKTKRV